MDSFAGSGSVPRGKRGKGTYVAGLVMLSIGAVHANVGFVVLGLSEGDDDAAGVFVPNLIVGGTLMIIGAILTPVGLHRMRQSPSAMSPGGDLNLAHLEPQPNDDQRLDPPLVERSSTLTASAQPWLAPFMGPTVEGGLMFGLGGTL